MESSEPCGVIVGRFQIHQLHQAHRELINSVLSRHKNVIVFLGCSTVLGSKRNPLDFRARSLMLLEEFGDKITVLPLYDKNSNAAWAKELDSRIREVYPNRKAILYGSRDSFIPFYEDGGGKNPTIELESKIMVSGTEIRKNVSDEILSDAKFRAGIIHARYNTYDSVFPTVDIAVQRGEEFLFGKKPFENKFRFIGGFVDPTDVSLKHAARREVREEATCEVDGFEYIESILVDDWRYRKESSKIMTNFFLAQYISGRVEPNDDISSLQWFKLEDLSPSLIMPEHVPLFELLIKFMDNKK